MSTFIIRRVSGTSISGKAGLALLLVVSLICFCPVLAAVDVSKWGGKPKPELDMGGVTENAIGELMLGKMGAIGAAAQVGSNYDLDTNAMFRSAPEWKKMADANVQQMKDNGKDEVDGHVPAFTIRQNELAISTWQANNAQSQNDKAISDAYVDLAATYQLMGPDYDDLRYQALEAAAEAEPRNLQVWNQRIDLLKKRGLTAEAADMEKQRNQQPGTSTVLFGLPLSILPGLTALIAGILILRFWKNTG